MQIPTDYNEQEIVQHLARGNQQAFRQFYAHYVQRIFNNALQFTKSVELAKDLTQEIFIKVWTNRQKMAGVQNPGAFLFVIARNTIFDALKKQLHPVQVNEYLENYLWDDSAASFSKLEFRELKEKLDDAVNTLPPQMQTVFRLSRIEGLSHAQIASRLQISEHTSKSYIVRALITLRKFMEDHGHKLPVIFFLSGALGRFFFKS